MRARFRSATLAVALAAALASCGSIPSLNEPPVYSSYVEARKAASGQREMEVFVLDRISGAASDDSYEYRIEREKDAAGAAAIKLVLRYLGGASESINRISAKVDDRELGLGESAAASGYSGRRRLEVVEAALDADAAAAIMAGKKMTLQYYGKYPTFPIEIPGPGLEALKAFLGN
jgi:predicted small lipoprotein YifL